MSLKTGDFGLNPEHPPLVKMLAALPLLSMDLKVPPLQQREFKHEAFFNGKEFVFGNDADTLLFRARMAASLLTVLLALLVFLRGSRDVRAGGRIRRADVAGVRSESAGARRARDDRRGAFVLPVRGGVCVLSIREAANARFAWCWLASRRDWLFRRSTPEFLAAPIIALLALVEWLRNS